MAKKLYCPYFISYGDTTRYCMNGRFWCNCEECDCPDKRYIEINTSNNYGKN